MVDVYLNDPDTTPPEQLETVDLSLGEDAALDVAAVTDRRSGAVVGDGLGSDG